MAITLRLTEQQENQLKKIADSVESATMSKTINFMIEHWMSREEIKKSYYDELKETKQELNRIKRTMMEYWRYKSMVKDMEEQFEKMSL